jgi:hypothetical protein
VVVAGKYKGCESVACPILESEAHWRVHRDGASGWYRQQRVLSYLGSVR